MTACSSRKRSVPPPAWKSRSSWRSAAAIEVTWAWGPWRWECVSLSGSESSRKSKRSCSTRYAPTQPACWSRMPGRPSCERHGRLAAGEDVGVEELLRAHHRPAEDRRGQPREGGVLRRLVLVAPAVHQIGRPRGAHAGVVERLEHREHVGRQVRGVHVVDRVGQLLDEPEAPRGAERRAVLDVAALVARVPVHRRDVMGVLAHARWRSVAAHAGVTVGKAAAQSST